MTGTIEIQYIDFKVDDRTEFANRKEYNKILARCLEIIKPFNKIVITLKSKL